MGEELFTGSMIYCTVKSLIPISAALSQLTSEVMIPVDKSMIAPGFGGVMVAESILFKVIFSPPAIATTTCVAACW